MTKKDEEMNIEDHGYEEEKVLSCVSYTGGVDTNHTEISVTLKELIKTADFCNVEVGPFTAKTVVPSDKVAEETDKLYETIAEVHSKKRGEVISSLAKAKESLAAKGK